MKKTIAGYSSLLLCLLLLISGCGVKEEDEEFPESAFLQNEGEIATNGDKYIVVGLSQVGSESDWRITSTKSFQSTFTQENGYYLLYEDGQQKQENQLKAVRNFILQEVDYIVLDPIVETGWDGVLQEAKDAGIPVILTDRSVETTDENLYTCWVGSDFGAEGERAGEWLASYLENQDREKDRIRIVTLQGTPGSTAQIGRTEGFDRVLEENDNWTMLDRQSGDFTQAKAEEVMEQFLTTYDDIDVVICENDNMAFGAVEAIHKAGKTCGPDGEIIIISFDGMRAGLEAMIRGEVNVIFECNPLLGPEVEEIIQRLERGESVEKIRYVKETYYDTSMDLESILENRAY